MRLSPAVQFQVAVASDGQGTWRRTHPSEAGFAHAGAIRGLVCGVLRALGVNALKLRIRLRAAGILRPRLGAARLSGSALILGGGDRRLSRPPAVPYGALRLHVAGGDVLRLWH